MDGNNAESCTESVVQLDSTVAIQNSILVARNEDILTSI